MTKNPGWTYRAAGVDVTGGEEFVQNIAEVVRSTQLSFGGRILGGLRSFAGMFRLGEGFRDPVLVSGTDGVGTKLLVAQRMGRHASVGIDLVAMCVNDVLTVGARPLFFLDYLASGNLDSQVLSSVVGGIAEGCCQAGCALLGGETAEMPDVYGPGVYDLAGFAVGVVERDTLIDGSRVREGNVLLGLASSGLHSNGYSLVRRVFSRPEDWMTEVPHPALGRPLGEELLEPTRIYARALGALGEGGIPINGISHITGGGIPGNLGRIVPNGLQARVHPGNWPLPPIFDLLRTAGPIAPEEMYATFNMGLGLVIATERPAAEAAQRVLEESGERGFVVGEVVVRDAEEPEVRIEGF